LSWCLEELPWKDWLKVCAGERAPFVYQIIMVDLIPYTIHNKDGEEQSLNHSHDVQAFALSHKQPQTVLGLPSFELDMYKAQRTGGYISDT